MGTSCSMLRTPTLLSSSRAMPHSSMFRRLGRSLIDTRAWLFDIRHSIETRASVQNPPVDSSYLESAARPTRYEAIRLRVLRRMIAEGFVPPTFLDVACGKARAGFFAAAVSGRRRHPRSHDLHVAFRHRA